jgi:hypothetical protein
MSTYELAILGDVSADERTMLGNTISDIVGQFGLAVGSEVL